MSLLWHASCSSTGAANWSQPFGLVPSIDIYLPTFQSLACRETIEEIAEYLEDCASELDYELQQQQQQAVQVSTPFHDM